MIGLRFLGGKSVPKVPNVAKLTEDAATEALTTIGLVVARSEVGSNAVDPGLAIDTDPPAGTDVANGATVTLRISTRPATPTLTVPNLTGKPEQDAIAALAAAGLRMGARSLASDAAIAAGNIIASTPPADTEVEPGSAVALQISTGPAVQPSTPVQLVEVPDLFGFTVSESKRLLEKSGLTAGKQTRQNVDYLPKGAVTSSVPAARQLVPRGSPVTLEVSDGPEQGWGQYLIPGLLALIGLIFVGAILYALFGRDQRLLMNLADRTVARGLITFLIAISTVGIAIILAVSTVVSAPTTDDDKRFDRAKQVLTILIGVLGTIVGFYFGSTADNFPAPRIKIALPKATIGRPFISSMPLSEGLTPPVKWTVDPPLPGELLLDETTGQVSGTPTVAEKKKEYTFKAVDSANPPHILDQKIEFEVETGSAKTSEPASGSAGQ